MKIRGTGVRRGGLIVALAGVLVGCDGQTGGGTTQGDDQGVIQLAVMQVPANVACLRITAMGASRTVVRSIDVAAAATASAKLAGLPTGVVTVSSAAYPVACAAVTATTEATWVGDPITVSLAAGVPVALQITMRQNGRIDLAVDFVADSAPFTFSGVVNDLPVASLTGWTQCYVDRYSDTGTSIAAVQAACPGANLLVGCRQTGSSVLQVAANAPRADVFFDNGGATMCNDPTRNTPHVANGASWYFSPNFSWGFAAAGDALSLCECDVETADAAHRVCFHTKDGGLLFGYRCGANTALNDNAQFERVIFTSP